MQHPQILFYCQAGRYALTNFVYKSALFHRLMHISVYSHVFFLNPGFSIQAHLRGGLVDPFFTWVVSSQIYLKWGFCSFSHVKKKNLKSGILFAGDCCICNNYSRICLWEKWNGGAWNGSSLWMYMASGFCCRSRNQVQLLTLASGLHTYIAFWMCIFMIHTPMLNNYCLSCSMPAPLRCCNTFPFGEIWSDSMS